MFLTLNHICPNNLPIWKSVTKPQQINEHMRGVINHLTHIHLLNTINSILAQTLEKFCKQRVYGKQTLTTCISKTLLTKLITVSQYEIEKVDCIQYIKNMCIKIEKKQHMKRQVKEHSSVIYKANISTMYVKMVTRSIYKI